MRTHNICFCREIRKILCGYPLLSVAMTDSDIGLVDHFALFPKKGEENGQKTNSNIGSQDFLALLSGSTTELNISHFTIISMPASVAKLDAPSDWRPGGRGFNPRRGRQHSFVEIDHEIFSTVILSLPLIQEGQLSVSGERMCTILVNRLED